MGWAWVGKLRRTMSAPPSDVVPASGRPSHRRATSEGDGGEGWQEQLLRHFQLLEVLGDGGYSTV